MIGAWVSRIISAEARSVALQMVDEAVVPEVDDDVWTRLLADVESGVGEILSVLDSCLNRRIRA